MTAKGSSVSLTFRLIGVVILSVIVSICLVTISTTDTLKKDVANVTVQRDGIDYLNETIVP